MPTTGMQKNNDREASFLASQQARLEKIRSNTEKNALLNTNDDNAQQRRKEFWSLMKSICSSLNSRLKVLLGEEVVGNDGDHEESPNSNENEHLYVTAQQRNEALAKLQDIQVTLRYLSHYTLRTGKLTSTATTAATTTTATATTSQDEKYLPKELIGFTMPDLLVSDLRLLNEEIQNLKNLTEKAQNIIMPKEKFRFRKYREAIQKRKEKFDGFDTYLDDADKVDVDMKENDIDNNDKNENTSYLVAHQSNGVSLVDKKDCSVTISADGLITVSNESSTSTIQSSDAQAFTMQNLQSCNVLVDDEYSSMHIVNTKKSTIRIQKPIAGPIHVTDCHDTDIQIKFCHQLRIHDCTNVSFTLHVSSGPIIEGCKGMKFIQSEYNSSIGEDNLCVKDNLYWDVKDFHWLKNIKSPNFVTVSEEERKKEMLCNRVVNDESSLNDDHDDISSEDEL